MMRKYVKNKEQYEFNPPQEIGWEGDRFEIFKQNVWKEVKTRIHKDTDIYVHAYHNIIYDVHTYRYLDTFVFKTEYWNEVEQILGNTRKELVGVHIRRTDHDKCIRMSPLHAFLVKMNQLIEANSQLRFFLATDDEDIQKELISRYGDKIIIQDKVWGRDSKNGMKSGIIDCLCLSRCSLVLGSCTSAFSEFAARYGNIELIQIVE